MKPKQLAELQKLVDALPASPWFLVDCEGDLQLWLESAVKDIVRDADDFVTGYRLPAVYRSTDLIAEWDLNTWDPGEDEYDDQRRAYARFMETARTAVPALLAEVKRLRTNVGALITQLGDAATDRDRLRAELATMADSVTEAEIDATEAESERDEITADRDRLSLKLARIEVAAERYGALGGFLTDLLRNEFTDEQFDREWGEGLAERARALLTERGTR